MPTVATSRRKAAPARRVKLSAAAEMYGISVKTLRRRISTGDLTGYRLGNRLILVDLDELEALMRPIPSAGGADVA